MQNNKKGFIITGVGTEVGKTYITTSLLNSLIKNGYKATAYKPVQSGVNENELSDVECYKKVASNVHEPLYSFNDPCSPHLAAARVKERIDFQKVVKKSLEIVEKNEITLIEGAGGIYVPMDGKVTFLDLFKELDLPIILVASNRLGAINEVFLTFKALELQGLDVCAIIINNLDGDKDYIKYDNFKYISKHFPETLVLDFPYGDEEFFSPFLDMFMKHLDVKDMDIEFDKEHIWHPYTSMSEPLKCYGVQKTKGNYLYLQDKKLLDGMSSWWCAMRGYGDEEINDIASKQLYKMSHVMFGGITHNEAIDLTKLLINITPKSLQHVFYADSGSVSVEVALKMAMQYHAANHHPKKKRFMTFLGGYHGDTFGAMSVCDPKNGMHSLYGDVLPKQIFLPRPKSGYDEKISKKEIKNIKKEFKKHHKSVAAFIVEPVVQGAGGMWIYNPKYLQIIKELCEKYDILFICDEVATGFGRTGKLFAVNHADVEPDIMCVGKAMSGGYMSFAAVLTNKKVAFGISKDGGVLMHGPTFMANPLACAISKKNLELLMVSRWQEEVLSIQKSLKEHLVSCKSYEDVKDVRVLGAIGVVELKSDINVENLQKYFVKQGVWIRPFGKLLYIMPPFTISKDELKFMCEVIKKSIKKQKYL